MGQKSTRASRYAAAIPLFKRAVELDPDFAEAWRSLGMSQSNIDRIEDALESSQKAYDLRGRVSELERLQIESSYYMVRGDKRRVIEILDVAVQAYPRSYISWNNLAYNSKRYGLDERAIGAYRHAIELAPDSAGAHRELIDLLFAMNRNGEANQYCAQAASRQIEVGICRTLPFFLAVRAGDTAKVNRELDRIAALPDAQRFGQQKGFAAFQGRISEARELSRRWGKCIPCGGLEVPFDDTILMAEAVAGRCDLVESDLARGKPGRNEFSLARAVFATAACQDTKHTQAFMADLLKVSPNDTFKSDVYAPCLQSLAAGSHDPLQGAAATYEVARKDTMSPAGVGTLYCRGQVYLAQNKGTEAAAQFQAIIDNPVWFTLSAFYAPAWAGVAKAAAMSGDTARSRKAYDEFFRLWSAANPDLPLLIEAKRASHEVALTK
jgi:tetratricopeptide (TPR) repeat protein